jgi:hypothetical protein
MSNTDKRFDIDQTEAMTEAIVAGIAEAVATLRKLDPNNVDEDEAAKNSEGFVAILPSMATAIHQHVHAIENGFMDSGEPVSEELVSRLVRADLRIVDVLQQLATTLAAMSLHGPLLDMRHKLDEALTQLAAAIDILKKAAPRSVN